MCDIAIKRHNERTTNGVYFELMLYPWDYAAASLIVMEAGGFISTAEGGMITLDQPCFILAAGRQCWKEASQLLSE
ncbi:inositol monophosphatase family protein [Blautia glucerasea]